MIKKKHQAAYSQAIWLAGLALAAALLASAPQARAVENGATITPMGIFDFGAGYLPPATPVGFFGVRIAYYGADELKDNQGKKSLNDLNLKVLTIGLSYIHMTHLRLLGGQLGFGTVVPLLNIDGKLHVPTAKGTLTLSSDNFALGDMQFLPIMIGWRFGPHGATNAGLQVQAPTGSYDSSRAFNNGVNHWTISPYVAGTWIFGHGYELSSLVQFNYNTENPADHYQSGVEYYQEYAAGKHFGPFVACLGGYIYQQLTDDSAPNVTFGNRARVFAVGPALVYQKPHRPIISLHAYKEFGAKNRAQGYNLAVRIGMAF